MCYPHFVFTVQDIRYEKIKPAFDGQDLNTSGELRFCIPPSHDYFTSFLTDYQLVADCSIQVEQQPPAAGAEAVNELLWPARHRITLPVNGLNILFKDFSTHFNHHTPLDTDRYGKNFFFLFI